MEPGFRYMFQTEFLSFGEDLLLLAEEYYFRDFVSEYSFGCL